MTSWILVQKRAEGVQAGDHSGWIHRGMRRLARFAEPPDMAWHDYLLERYGEGRYLVTTQNPINGQLMVLFRGPVRYDDPEGVAVNA